MSARKSYWQKMGCRTERDKIAIKSWFDPFADDLTPESADILCDIETDREKKLRVVMVDADGAKFRLTRTIGKRGTTIKRERMTSATGVTMTDRKAPSKEGERSELSSSREWTEAQILRRALAEAAARFGLALACGTDWINGADRTGAVSMRVGLAEANAALDLAQESRRSTPAGRGEGGWRA